MCFFTITDSNATKLSLFEDPILDSTIAMIDPANAFKQIVLVVANADDFPLMNYESELFIFIEYLIVPVELRLALKFY